MLQLIALEAGVRTKLGTPREDHDCEPGSAGHR